jgi:pyrroline-5-carboxylate reductase
MTKPSALPALPTIAILGYGTMGQALARGLLTSGLATKDTVALGVRRPLAPSPAAELGLAPMTTVEAAGRSSIVILAVKPKDMEGLLDHLHKAGALAHSPLVISIAAGVGTVRLAEHLGGCPVLRAMPNTPCSIGKGATVLCKGPGATEAHAALGRRLFEPLGAVLELDEKHMDTVTALSGSGPAFVYLMLEAMAEGGVMQGLPRAVSLELAARAALGAAEMILATGRHPASLRDDVTTPAGCTVAGLMVLEDGKLRSVLARGVEKAARVAGDLSR